MNGKNRFSNNKYDINGFDINGIHKDTKTKHDSNGFNMNGIHKDIKISFGEDTAEKKILKNTLWLENRYNFLKSFIKLIGEKDITETVNNKVISSEISKNFINAISNGIIDNNNIKEAYNKYFSDIEKNLAKSKSNKNVDQIKKLSIRIKNLVNKNDKKKLQSTDTDSEYDTDMLPLETEEESAENIANIYESRDNTRKK